jgi:hypothetical protein
MHANNSQGERLELLYGLRNFRLLMAGNSRTGKKPFTFQAWCTVSNLSGSDNLAFAWGRSRSSRSNEEPSLRAQFSALTFLHRAQRRSWHISSRRTRREKSTKGNRPFLTRKAPKSFRKLHRRHLCIEIRVARVEHIRHYQQNLVTSTPCHTFYLSQWLLSAKGLVA